MLPIGWLYTTDHPLQEPEKSIEYIPVLLRSDNSVATLPTSAAAVAAGLVPLTLAPEASVPLLEVNKKNVFIYWKTEWMWLFFDTMLVFLFVFFVWVGGQMCNNHAQRMNFDSCCVFFVGFHRITCLVSWWEIHLQVAQGWEMAVIGPLGLINTGRLVGWLVG